MKANIHPTWYPDAKVICACGNTFTTGSTLPQIKVEICSQCHPLFTGQQKFVDTLGQIDKYQNKIKAAEEKQKERAKILQARAQKAQEVKKDRPTLKDLLLQARKTS